MIFQNTPGTEAPAEMNTYFPDMKAFWAAENITGTVHNIYTLRGALVRDALQWSKSINEALYHFGMQAEAGQTFMIVTVVLSAPYLKSSIQPKVHAFFARGTSSQTSDAGDNTST